MPPVVCTRPRSKHQLDPLHDPRTAFDGFIKVLGRYSFYVPCADFFQYQAGPGRLADRA